MVDVDKELAELKKGGLPVKIIVGPSGKRYCVGDYQLQAEHLVTLGREGKLHLDGTKELHARIKKDIYNQWTTKHGSKGLRVGHDLKLEWYMVMDGEWRLIESGGTRKKALETAHLLFHEGKDCKETLKWELDQATRSKVWSECPTCMNPATEDRGDHVECTDCGWKIKITPEQMAEFDKQAFPRL